MTVLVGICGGSGSGKSTLADRLVARLRADRGPEAAAVLSFDSYYHDLLHLTPAERAVVNFDHPDSLDHELLLEHLDLLAEGRSVAVPVYDFANHTRSGAIRIIEPADVVVVEGILLFSFAEVRERLDFRVFRRCPEEVRFGRRTARDVAERGRSLESVEEQLARTVKPMHDRYVEPHVADADFVTEHGQDLDAVTDEVAERISALVGTSGLSG